MNNYPVQRNILILLTIAIILGVVFVVKVNIGPISIPPNDDMVEHSPKNALTSRLTVPEGFMIQVFADDVPGARVIAFDPRGRVIVSQTKEGKISVLQDTNSDGVADEKKVLAENLDKPHGLAFDCPIDDRGLPCHFYVAEHGRLGRYAYDAEIPTLSSYKKLIDFESSITDRHVTRTLLFLPSPREYILLVSVGSSCDVCRERGTMRGKIMAYDVQAGTLKEYARGLRNAVFMTLDSVSGKVFATEMGRDGLGDDVPPDEVNVIEQGKNYGWPICYGKNIHDTDFDKNTYIRNPCMEPFETESFIDLQAHSAPLGLAFIPEEGWQDEYRYNLLVAFHGSWNRSEPTGYKIVRLKLDAQGRYMGTEDFITGWLTTEGTKLGRPVDVKVLSGGVAYISDDESGVIYRVMRKR